jgi:UDP-N-acetyl-2-amino-2-deoxyglucuronate dehydrogenase
MKKFGLIGAAGYIAPRHMRAIKDTGNDLVWVVDPSDSVGILDQYFPNCSYFPDIHGHGIVETHDHASLHAQTGMRAYGHEGMRKVDYVTVCSPNFLHEQHIRWALEQGAEVICEKPLVIDLDHLEEIERLERESGKRVNTIMQLRLHPVVETLRLGDDKTIRLGEQEKRKYVKLEYVTARGRWYYHSWKGLEEKSGGIVMNIGIHLFDLMTFLYGPMKSSKVDLYQPDRASGILELEQADVEWFLSINADDLPAVTKAAGHRAFRNISLNGQSIEFTEGFTELHTLSYKEILEGRGFGINDVRESLRVVDAIRRQ